MIKAARIKVCFDPKKWERALAGKSRLVEDRSGKSGSIQKRSLTKLATEFRKRLD